MRGNATLINLHIFINTYVMPPPSPPHQLLSAAMSVSDGDSSAASQILTGRSSGTQRSTRRSECNHWAAGISHEIVLKNDFPLIVFSAPPTQLLERLLIWMVIKLGVIHKLTQGLVNKQRQVLCLFMSRGSFEHHTSLRYGRLCLRPRGGSSEVAIWPWPL